VALLELTLCEHTYIGGNPLLSLRVFEDLIISLIRIVFCHVSKNLPLHCLFYVTMNIYFRILYQYYT